MLMETVYSGTSLTGRSFSFILENKSFVLGLFHVCFLYLSYNTIAYCVNMNAGTAHSTTSIYAMAGLKHVSVTSYTGN